MNRQLRDLSVRTLQGAAELLLFLPVLLLAAFALPAGAIAQYFALLLLLYPIGLLLQRGLKLRRRFLLLLVAGFVSAAAGFALFPLPQAAALVFFIGALTIYRSMRMAFAPWNRMFHEGWMLTGLILQFVLQFVYRYQPLLHRYAPLVSWSGLAAFIVCMFILNDRHVRGESAAGESRGKVYSPILRRNRGLMSVLLLVIVFAANILNLWALLLHALRGLFQLVKRLFPHSANRPPIAQPSAQPGQMPLPPAKPNHSWLLHALEIAAAVLAAAVVLALLALIAIALAKWARKWFSYLAQRFASEQETGYIDEKASTLDRDRWRLSLGALLGRWRDGRRTEPDLDSAASNAEKIRMVFRKLMRRAATDGFALRRAYTAAEALTALANFRRSKAAAGSPRKPAKRPEADDGWREAPEELAKLYDRARYSGHAITDEDVKKAGIDMTRL